MANLGAADTQIREAAAASRAAREAHAKKSESEDIPAAGIRSSSEEVAEKTLVPPVAPRPFSPPPAWVKGGSRTSTKKRYNLLNVRAPGAHAQLPPPPSQGISSSGVVSEGGHQKVRESVDGLPQLEPGKVILLPPIDIPGSTMKRGAEQAAEGSSSGKKARVESPTLPTPEVLVTAQEAELTRQATALKPERLAPHLESVLAAFNTDYTPTLWEEIAQIPIMVGVEELAALGAQVISLISPMSSFLAFYHLHRSFS